MGPNDAFDRYRKACDDLAYDVLGGTSFDTRDKLLRLSEALLETIEAECEDLEREKAERDEAAYGDHIDREIDRLREGEL